MTQDRPPREIPEFRDIEQRDDGSWTAVHATTGVGISAPTFEDLDRVQAPLQRIANAWTSSAEIPFTTGDPA